MDGLEASVLADPGTGAMIATLVGELTLHAMPSLRSTLLRCMAAGPSAVVVDLGRLTARRPALLSVFASARRFAAQPSVPMALCGGPADIVQHVEDGAADPGLRRYDTVEAGVRAAASALHDSDRRRARLPADRTSAASARRVVAEALESWRSPQSLPMAQLVVSELVSNAIEHARSEMDLVLLRRDHYVHVGVHDRVPDPDAVPLPPQLRSGQRRQSQAPSGAPLSVRGRGLLVVATQATNWGCARSTSGKVVWATLRLSRSPDRPAPSARLQSTGHRR